MANSSIGSRPWLSEAHNKNCSYNPVVLLIYTQKWILNLIQKQKSFCWGDDDRCGKLQWRHGSIQVCWSWINIGTSQDWTITITWNSNLQDGPRRCFTIRRYQKHFFLADQENDSFCPVIVPSMYLLEKDKEQQILRPKVEKNGVHAWIPTKA